MARCSPPCPARSPWPSPCRFNRAARQRPCTEFFQIAVCTMRPFHSMSRGSPTFTDNSRVISLPNLGGTVPNILYRALCRGRFGHEKRAHGSGWGADLVATTVPPFPSTNRFLIFLTECYVADRARAMGGCYVPYETHRTTGRG